MPRTEEQKQKSKEFWKSIDWGAVGGVAGTVLGLIPGMPPGVPGLVSGAGQTAEAIEQQLNENASIDPEVFNPIKNTPIQGMSSTASSPQKYIAVIKR